jgi:NAD(P)-dependent dehydrogenase (short-subunit alcohol dehydrogenase family)
VVFEDVNFSSRRYDPLVAYGQSKTAVVLFAVEASRRWAGDGITANAVHPGADDTTNLSRYIDPEELEQIKASGSYLYKTSEQAAATSVLVATWPPLEGIGGRYFQDCNEAPVVDAAEAEATGAGVAAYALDPANAERLWELSLAALS